MLISENAARELREAKRAGLRPTKEQLEAFEARARRPGMRNEDGSPRNLSVAGDVAEIRVEGVLTKKPDLFAFLFGGGNSTYEELQEAFAFARMSEDISRVQLVVDSPGGDVDGFFETLAALEELKADKSINVRADNALSAAYGIAALAGPIEATNVGAAFGSVGVAASFLVLEEVVTLTNSESPRKRPDLTTEEGRKIVVEHLDAIADLLIDAVARGRGTTAEDVTKNFGRGGNVLAGDARERGMIDTIASPRLQAVPGGQEDASGAQAPVASAAAPRAASGGESGTRFELAGASRAPAPSPAPPQQTTTADSGGASTEERRTMDELTKDKLRAQHPQLYEAVLSEGKEQGIREERDRVEAHLTLGKQSGDLETAHNAICDGSEMTQAITAKYLAAGMARSDRDIRQRETDEAGEVADRIPLQPSEEPKDLIDRVAEAMDNEEAARG